MIEAVLTLSGIGLVASLGLGLAAKRFAVRLNPLLEQVEQALPGGNCGACGVAGCNAYAQAVVQGSVPLNACIPGGQETASRIAEIMGVAVPPPESRVAVLLCGGGIGEARSRFQYRGISDCKAATIVAGGDKSCAYGCLGLGTCEEVCPFDAVRIDEDGLAAIDEERCTGCGICVNNCPKEVLALAPRGMSVHVRCHSPDKGAKVKRYCDVGCIGCGACVRTCPFDALRLDGGLAVIDYSRCRQCGLCVDHCPTHTITGLIRGASKARIDPSRCTGCAICDALCPVDALSGEPEKPHFVDDTRCIGCKICSSVCPAHAITIVNLD
jgi:electron transport complex protein RnfB